MLIPKKCLWATLLVLAFALTVSAQQAQLVLRPINSDDITAYKLPATMSHSGGLSTVGLGQALYLEAELDINVPPGDIASVAWELTDKPANSKAVFSDSPLGTNVPIYEPADRLIFQVAGRKLLRVDVPGVYLVTATITTVSAGTAVVKRMLVGSTYVGIQACSGCHANGPDATPWSMANAWSKTAHASMFKNGINGVLGDHYGSACLPCHTDGYDADPLATNGNFADVAKKLNWTFPTTLKDGNWDALPAAIKNTGNIQCENCHGPGSTHIASGGDPRLITVSMASGTCGQCHGAMTHHVKTGEWNNSLHAITTRDPSGPGRESCVGCHTGNGFLGKTNEDQTVNTDYSAITCQTCHEPHGETAPGTNAHLIRKLTAVKLRDGTMVTTGGNGMLCMNCHQSRQNAATYVATTVGSARFGPHHGPQADMLMGVNAITYGKKIPSSAHADVVGDTCVTCHMQAVDAADPALSHVGGHTFKVSWPGNGTLPAKDMVAACQGCHGPDVTSLDFPLMDYDDDGVIDGAQTEVSHMLDQLAYLLPPVGQAKTSLTIDSTWTLPQLQAAYNWQFVKNDGSYGIHNMAYAVGLLKASIADMEKNNTKK